MEHRNTDNHIILDKSHLEIMSDLLNMNLTDSMYNKILNSLYESISNYNEAVLVSTICELIPKENISIVEDFFTLICGDLTDESFYFRFDDGTLFAILISLDDDSDKTLGFVFSNMYIDLFKDIEHKSYEEELYVDCINHYRDLYDFLPEYFKKYYEVIKRKEPLE